MSNLELQEEEREVLLSIYEGDCCFKDLSSTVYQYRYGEENDPASFLLEISWTKDYPSQKPKINMDTFYNKHLKADLKEKIENVILQKAEQHLGEAMTYSLFEFLKEIRDELTKDISGKLDVCYKAEVEMVKEENLSKKTCKKEQLTKAQKRKEWDKLNAKGEKPRGWDWVDLIKHLSQTGQRSNNQQVPPNN